MPLVLRGVLAVGAAAGLFNGLLVTRVGLPSLAVTIGTLTLYRGIAVVILGPNDRLRPSRRGTRTSGSNGFPDTGGSSRGRSCIFLVLAVDLRRRAAADARSDARCS